MCLRYKNFTNTNIISSYLIYFYRSIDSHTLIGNIGGVVIKLFPSTKLCKLEGRLVPFSSDMFWNGHGDALKGNEDLSFEGFHRLSLKPSYNALGFCSLLQYCHASF